MVNKKVGDIHAADVGAGTGKLSDNLLELAWACDAVVGISVYLAILVQFIFLAYRYKQGQWVL